LEHESRPLHESEKAIRTRDKKFFRAALDALETNHRMPDANPKNIYTRRIHHVLATLRINYGFKD